MLRYLSFLTAAFLILPVKGDSLNFRQGYPLPVPWETGRLDAGGKVAALQLSADGKALYGVGWDTGSMAWDLATKQSIPLPPEEEAKLNLILKHSNDGTPHPRPTVLEPIYESEPCQFRLYGFVHDDHTGYQVMDDGSVQIQDLTKRPPPSRWPAHSFKRSFAVDPDTGNLIAGDLTAWDVKTGTVLGDQSIYKNNAAYLAEGIYWQKSLPYGLVTVRAQRAPPSASLPYGGTPADFDQLGKLDLKSGQVVSKTPLFSTAYFSVSRSGHYVAVSYRSPPMGLKDSAAGKTPSTVGPADMELRPSLQLFDADLKPVGSGFTMSPDLGTAEVSFSPGDKLVGAVGAADSEAGKTSVRVFDPAIQNSLLPQPLLIASLASIAVTDDGYLFVATKYGSITEYRVPSGEKVNELDKAHQRLNVKLAVSPDNKILATTAEDDLIKLWSIPDLKPLGFLEAPNGQQESWYVGFGFYDNNTVVDLTTDTIGDLRLLPINGALDFSTWNVDSSESAGTCLAISSDGKQLAIGQANGVLTVVDNTTGKRLFHVAANSGGIREIEYAEGSYKLNTYGADDKCLTWDLANATNPTSETDDKPTFQTLAIVTGTGPKTLHQGDTRYTDATISVSPSPGAYRESEVSPHYKCSFNRMCALPGGKLIALSTWTNLYLYDLQSERLVWGYSAPSRPSGLVYDSMHHQLISSHEDGVTRRWVVPDSIQQTFRK